MFRASLKGWTSKGESFIHRDISKMVKQTRLGGKRAKTRACGAFLTSVAQADEWFQLQTSQDPPE